MKRLALIFCLIVVVTIWSGCRPSLSLIAINHESDIARPTFCLHDRRGKSEHVHSITKPLYIREIVVHRYLETEEHNQRELGIETPWRGWDKCFWRMQYLPENKKTTHPLHCIRYGDVPPGYKELVPAQPLKPGRVYSVDLYGFEEIINAESMKFILRPDSSGALMQLEYDSAYTQGVIKRQAKEQ